MNKCRWTGPTIVAIISATMMLLNPALAGPYSLEARMAPAAFVPEGTALAVRYDQGPEIRLGHDWHTIAVVSPLNNQPDHHLLRYRLIVERVDQVHASALSVAVQYRVVALE